MSVAGGNNQTSFHGFELTEPEKNSTNLEEII